MKKSELVTLISEKSGLNKKQSEGALNAFMEVVKENVGDAPIPLVGFGKFEVKHRKARQQRSPQDGSIINVPSSNRVTFVAGKDLKEAVN